MALRARTPDGRKWAVLSIGHASPPPEWIIVASCEDDSSRRVFGSDLQAHELPAHVLTQTIETADALAPETLDQWAVRPAGQPIQPPAQNYTPGPIALPTVGAITRDGSVELRLRESELWIHLKVRGEYLPGLYSGIVEDVEAGVLNRQRLIGRAYAFMENHVFAVA
ncbi:MAG TPA: hypothetical protein VMU02_10175 [bacterium]|nr:hypothetical protein [bacterium]